MGLEYKIKTKLCLLLARKSTSGTAKKETLDLEKHASDDSNNIALQITDAAPHDWVVVVMCDCINV